MTDPRFTKLAETLIHYSCELQAGEKVLIEAIDTPAAFTKELVRVAHEAGVVPNVLLKSKEVLRRLLLGATEAQLDLMAASEETYMRGVDAYIGVRGAPNVSELSDVPQQQQKLYERYIWKRVHMDIRVSDTRWVVLRWPNPSMAQLAERSTEDFEDFYFRVCTMDYERMSEALQPLRALMEATDRVHIKGPGTDLRFSIAGIPAMPCDGKRNIPDGEVFTAPVKDSIEGTIQYNTPTIYQGVTHEDVFFRFEQGKIVEARSTDDGAPERGTRLGRGLTLHRGVLARLPPTHPGADEGHPVRREDRGQPAPHARERLRYGLQRKPEPDPLGPGPDPETRVRRRRGVVRRRADPEGRHVRPARARGAQPGQVGRVAGDPGDQTVARGSCMVSPPVALMV